MESMNVQRRDKRIIHAYEKKVECEKTDGICGGVGVSGASVCKKGAGKRKKKESRSQRGALCDV
jgi:hypothetical protein